MLTKTRGEALTINNKKQKVNFKQQFRLRPTITLHFQSTYSTARFLITTIPYTSISHIWQLQAQKLKTSKI